LELQASEKKQSKTSRLSETKSVQDFVQHCKKIAQEKTPPPHSASSKLSRSLDETSSKEDYTDKYDYLNVSNKV
jgi:hypothetical protein